MRFSVIAFFLFILSTKVLAAQAYLVESIPTGVDLPLLGHKYTAQAQIELVNRTKHTLDISAMYWNLIAKPSSQFSKARLQKLGASEGAELYDSLVAACKRGVHMRILSSTWTKQTGEANDLKEVCKNTVSIRTYDPQPWFKGGIMHAKVWIADDKDIYLGSANTDWLSLTQVKELGIVVEDSAFVAQDVKRLFEAWWHFAGISKPETSAVFSEKFQTERTFPCWSRALQEINRCENPLASDYFATSYNSLHPLQVTLNGERGELYVTNSPAEVSGPGREWDLDAIISTLKSATSTVDLSIMDFVPASLYVQPQSLWWSELSDTLLHLVTTKKIRARLLVSQWAQTNVRMMPYLKSLQALAKVCKISQGKWNPPCEGSLEIKVFEVPGWEDTKGAQAAYPPHSRVNHAKFIVTDQRANIGTSNWTWDYFYNTAGTSLNLSHESLRRTVADIFERDWNSIYAKALKD